ncbi:unnamed protein product, partial [Rotaria sp. Silwood1]
IDITYSSLSKSSSISSQSPSSSHSNYEIDQMISSKLSKQLKTMDRSKRKILSTSPLIPSPSTNLLFNQISQASSMDLEIPNNLQNPIPSSTFDLDVETERIDINLGRWSQMAPMLTPRSGAGCATVDRYIFACGGFDGKIHLSSVERYDSQINQWTNVTSMSVRRCYCGSAFIRGRIAVIWWL